jgi:hypothetical protein
MSASVSATITERASMFRKDLHLSPEAEQGSLRLVEKSRHEVTHHQGDNIEKVNTP